MAKTAVYVLACMTGCYILSMHDQLLNIRRKKVAKV